MERTPFFSASDVRGVGPTIFAAILALLLSVLHSLQGIARAPGNGIYGALVSGLVHLEVRVGSVSELILLCVQSIDFHDY